MGAVGTGGGGTGPGDGGPAVGGGASDSPIGPSAAKYDEAATSASTSAPHVNKKHGKKKLVCCTMAAWLERRASDASNSQ